LIDPAPRGHDVKLPLVSIGRYGAHRVGDLAPADEVVGKRPARGEIVESEEYMYIGRLDVRVDNRDTSSAGRRQQGDIRGRGRLPGASPIRMQRYYLSHHASPRGGRRGHPR